MDALERLIAIEEIRQLEARRIRCIDEKDWSGYAACHAPDAVSYTFQALGTSESEIVGADNIAAQVAKQTGESITVNQVHEPEIELTSDSTATGVWPVENRIWAKAPGGVRWMHAFGHYRETFVKIDGRWLIQSRRVTRLKADNGFLADAATA